MCNLIFIVLLLAASYVGAAEPACEVLQKIPSMGSIFEVQLIRRCPDKDDKELVLKIKKELDDIESELTLYRDDSPLQRLNSNGVLRGSFVHLEYLLRQSIKAKQDTIGAFDISIYPVLLKIQESFKKNKKPPQLQELDELRDLVDVKAIVLAEKKISLVKKGMKLTLDGIAKGYAVDRIAEIIESAGVRRYLLNFSGNMKWRGLRADGKPWQLARWNPIKAKTEKIKVGPWGAMASSGSEINHYSEDLSWHHIIDPITLRPPRLWSQVTVFFGSDEKASAMDCDILSTATYILPAEKIKQILKSSYPLYRVWAVDLRGKTQLIKP